MSLYIKIAYKCYEGLETDGENHKQWFLEEILKLLISKELYEKLKVDWDDGVIP